MQQSELVNRRLASQSIREPRFERPADVVRWMGAVQAQDYGQAVWAVAARTRSASLADVEAALARGEILRTWPMRGTIHFVPPENARWMVGLSAQRMVRSAARRREQLGLDDALLERARALFAGALGGGRRLARPKMLDLLEQNGISTAGQRGYHILYHLAQTGLICIGPMEGKQQTFALLDEWAPAGRDLSRGEALGELARRYTASHGPAAERDFAWWAGLTLTDARAALAQAGGALRSEQVDGVTYYLAADAPEPPPPDPQSVHLLPGYDEYFLGYADRSAVLEPKYNDRILTGLNVIFRPMVVLGGQIVGVWKRGIKKSGLTITVQPFHSTRPRPQPLEQAALRCAAFYGLPLERLAVEDA